MSIFLCLMLIGIIGMVLMAIPGFNRHGHGALTHHGVGHAGHGIGHAGHVGHGGLRLGAGRVGHAAGAQAPTAQAAPGTHAHHGAAGQQGDTTPGLMRLIPSPHAIFSLLTLYGAFGYALLKAGHLSPLVAGLLALIPALLIERFAVTPLWNALLQFQGVPDAPLETLILTEAEAVTPFRNGRGVVAVVRDGRLVQFSAHLLEAQARMPVHVGAKLRIEEIDADNERVTVSLL